MVLGQPWCPHLFPVLTVVTERLPPGCMVSVRHCTIRDVLDVTLSVSLQEMRQLSTINRCDVLTLDERAAVVYDIFSSEWARCVKAVVLSSSTMFCGIGAQTFPSFTY